MLAKAPGVKAFSARTKGSEGWFHPFWECPLPIGLTQHKAQGKPFMMSLHIPRM
jgi:hypothetical protein